MKRILRLFFMSIIKPVPVYKELLEIEKPWGLWIFVNLAYGIVGIPYTVVLLIRKIHPYIPPFIKIPLDVYYWYELFYYIPSVILFMIMATGILQIVFSIIKKSPEFYKLFTLVNFSILIPISVVWGIWDGAMFGLIYFNVFSPDFIYEQFATWGFLPKINTSVVIISMIWQTILMFITVRTVVKMKWFPTFILAFSTVVIYMGVWFGVFIR